MTRQSSESVRESSHARVPSGTGALETMPVASVCIHLLSGVSHKIIQPS